MENITYTKKEIALKIKNCNLLHYILYKATIKSEFDTIAVYQYNNKLYVMLYVDNNEKIIEFEVTFNKNIEFENKKIELLSNLENYAIILQLLTKLDNIDFSFQIGCGGLDIHSFETNL